MKKKTLKIGDQVRLCKDFHLYPEGSRLLFGKDDRANVALSNTIAACLVFNQVVGYICKVYPKNLYSIRTNLLPGVSLVLKQVPARFLVAI